MILFETLNNNWTGIGTKKREKWPRIGQGGLNRRDDDKIVCNFCQSIKWSKQ